MGISIIERKHHGEKGLCCSEGGAACLFSDLANKWKEKIKNESNITNRTITYCAGCDSKLKHCIPTGHILDLIFEPEKTLSGKIKVSNSPFTYFNRLKLKKTLKNKIDIKKSSERTFVPSKISLIKRKNKRNIVADILLKIIIGIFFIISTLPLPANKFKD